AAQAMVEKGHQVQQALGDTLGLSPKEDLSQARLFIDTLTTAGLQIAEQTTEELEWMRYHFAQVSEVMHRLLLASGWEGVPVYVQYCPMAFNDHGAYWLSADAEIRNPYFGRLLKECGEVLDTIH